MKITNSLPLSPVVISWLTRFYQENRCLKILRDTVALNSYQGLFCAEQKFRCFPETKQTQNEVGRYVFLQHGRICFRMLLRQSENFSQLFWQRVASLVKFMYKPKKKIAEHGKA